MPECARFRLEGGGYRLGACGGVAFAWRLATSWSVPLRPGAGRWAPASTKQSADRHDPTAGQAGVAHARGIRLLLGACKTTPAPGDGVHGMRYAGGPVNHHRRADPRRGEGLRELSLRPRVRP